MPSLVPDLGPTLGAFLVGLIVATFLSGVVTTQVYLYFNSCQNDRLSLRYLVGAVWLLDVIHLVVLCSMTYRYTITNWGFPPALADSTWGYDVSLFLTCIIASTIQTFFAWRTWVLTRSRLLTFMIILLSLISSVAGFTCGILTFFLVQFIKFVKYRWLASIWLVTSAACDILIAAALSWTLWKSRTGFKSTDTILTRLIVWTLNTGLLTSIVAVLVIILFDNFTNRIYFVFNMILAKLYASMFVATLNRRESNRKAFDNGRLHQSNLQLQSHANRRQSASSSPTTLVASPSSIISKRVSILNIFVRYASEGQRGSHSGGKQLVPLVDMTNSSGSVKDRNLKTETTDVV